MNKNIDTDQELAMNRTIWTITDTHTDATTTGDAYDTDAVVTGWYPDPDDVTAAVLRDVFAGLRAGYVDPIASEYLGLRIDEVA